jgi:hypothetical protein
MRMDFSLERNGKRTNLKCLLGRVATEDNNGYKQYGAMVLTERQVR